MLMYREPLNGGVLSSAAVLMNGLPGNVDRLITFRGRGLELELKLPEGSLVLWLSRPAKMDVFPFFIN